MADLTPASARPAAAKPDALTPKSAYAFDGLGSNTKLALSLWTVAHVEVTANGRVVRNDPDGEIGLSEARVRFIRTGSEEGDPVPEDITDEAGNFSGWFVGRPNSRCSGPTET